MTNLFNGEVAARRYQTYRPQYHEIPFSQLKAFIGSEVSQALDVACGTGHSTIALSKISERSVGCDLSSEMLAEARKHSDLEFIEAPAEKLPFEDHSIDLVNISMAIHWVDQLAFLRESKRVLKENGFLSIDNFGFTGRMIDNEPFTEAHRDFYRSYLPSAARHQDYPSNDLLTKSGFKLLTEIPYEQLVPMDLNEFANFIMTQSNFLNLRDQQRKDAPEAIFTSYEPFFGVEKKELQFRGLLKLYKSFE